MRLTQPQLAQLEADGYVIVDCPFDRQLTDACLEAVKRAAVAPEALSHDAKQNHYTLAPQIPDSFWSALDHAYPFLAIELHTEIVELSRQLAGTEDVYFRNGGINELAPGRGFLWHRDSEWDYIEIMHYFSDAAKADGCLRVIPGSQVGPADDWMEEVKRRRKAKGHPDPPTMDGPADVEMDGEIPLEVTSNQLIVRSSRILHATWKNTGDRGRLMHHWVYHRADDPYHRFTWRDYLTDDLVDALTEEQRAVLWLDREFEIYEKYRAERERELGRVRWGMG